MPEMLCGLRRLRIVGLTISFFASPLLGQNAPFVTITPHVATMRVGESRPFRLVNQDGQEQQNVSWSVSDAKALEISGHDDVTVTARQPGEFHLSARSAAGSDEITVTVASGPMAPGTILWSEPALPGCKAVKMTQAVPSQNGPDLYTESDCEDGHYVAAYTADGIQLWRRRITGMAAPAITTGATTIAAAPSPFVGMQVNVHARSICDSVSVGDSQQKTRALLEQRKLSFTEGIHTWTVEETGSECTVWFDDKGVIIKKRKTLVSE